MAQQELMDINKVMKSQEERLKTQTHLRQQFLMPDVNEGDVPTVHPQMVLGDIFNNQLPEEAQPFWSSNQSRDGDANLAKNGEHIKFDEIVSRNQGKIVAITGNPGSGKTTIAKRLTLLQQGLFYIFYFSLMEVAQATMTYQQFLIDRVYPDLDKKSRNGAFNWMRNNQEKCVFVFDAYDQAPWSMDNLKPLDTAFNYEDPLSVENLVAGMCCRKTFSKSTLILVSRSHTLLSLPPFLRPQTTIYVCDLAEDNMKKLFFAFAKTKAEEFWEILERQPNHLFHLCHNPMLMQFVLSAFRATGAKITQHAPSITAVFQHVIDSVERHEYSQDPLELKKISTMAFSGIERSDVTFTHKDLEKFGLSEVDVQDFVINTIKPGVGRQKLFDGDKMFYFSHHILLEYFAALYICKEMPDKTFFKFVKDLLKGGKWSMVRRFVCGLLLEHEQKSHNEKRLELVADLMKYDAFQASTNGTTIKGVQSNDLLEIMIDVQHFPNLIEVLAEDLCPSLIFYGYQISVNAFHVLTQFLVAMTKPIELLVFTQCNLTTSILHMIASAISEAKHGVKKFSIVDSNIGEIELEVLGDGISQTSTLTLENCGITNIRKLCGKIQENKKKISLNLRSNPIRDEGLHLLLKCLPFLDILELDHCEISDIADLSNHIKKLDSQMSVLNLRYNFIGDGGGEQLIKCLKKVKKMRVGGCNISTMVQEKIRTQLETLCLPDDTVEFM